jgi:predicted transposase YbfD/YdcC
VLLPVCHTDHPLYRGVRLHGGIPLGIENRLHWVRDTTFDEDRCQVRTAAAPRVLAALGNLAIGALRHAGATNIAKALRWAGREPTRAPAVLGL